MNRLLLALICLAALAAPPTRAADAPTTAQIEQIVRDYLVRNPEVLIEAMQAYERKKRDAQVAESTAAVRRLAKALRDDPDSHVGGNPKGDVTIVEFFDYRCAYCKQAQPELEAAAKRDGNVRIVYKEFPVLGPESVLAARAAIAVLRTQPSRYQAFHDALMASRGALGEAAIMQIAVEAGVKTADLKTAMQDKRIDEILNANHELAMALNIDGTPAFVIGDRLLPGAMPAALITEAIAAARAAKAK